MAMRFEMVKVTPLEGRNLWWHQFAKKNHTHALNGDNQLLIINEPVDFEKQSIEVQDFNKSIDHFRDIECNANHVVRTAPYELYLSCLCAMNCSTALRFEMVNVTPLEGRNL
jgi:hypothetical protein